jgi:hypothetical protein
MADMLGRRPEPEITREDVTSIMRFLMRIDANVEESRAVLIEEDDEEEDQEGP